MAGERVLVLKLVADVNKASQGIDRIDSKLGGFGKALGGLAALAIVDKAVGAVIDFGKEALGAASSIEESNARITQVLNSYGVRIKQFAKTSADAYGISEQAALDYGGQLATLFTAMGQTTDQAATSSVEFLALAADMASFSNVPIEEALVALQAGLRGESEPLRKFGVLLDEQTLKQEALAMGLIETTKGALSPQTRALAAQSLIMKQTAKQQGDVARTSDGLANSQKRLEAQLSDVTAEVGQALLPIITALVRFLSANLIPFVRKLWAAFQQVAKVVGPILGPLLEDLFDALRDLWTALAPLVKDLMPVFVAVGKVMGVVLLAIIKGFTGWIRMLTKVVGVLRDLVRWVKDAVRWVQTLLAKIPKIQLPDIQLPFSAAPARNIGGVAAASAGQFGARAAASGPGGASNVTVNIYGGDPRAVEATVLRALRGYARRNGEPQVLPSW